MTLYDLIVQAYTEVLPGDPEGLPTYHPPTEPYAQIAARLNAPIEIPNPVPSAPQVPAPITLKQLMAVVPPAEMVAVYKELPTYVADLKKAIDDQDRDYMAGLLLIAVTAQVISQATAGQLQGLLTATIDDPTWTPMIAGPSLAQQAGFGVVSPADVQAALHTFGRYVIR